MNVPIEELSEKQREIIALLLQGKRKKEIAASLHISPNTLKSHLSRVKAAMKIKSHRFDMNTLALRPPRIIVVEEDKLLMEALKHNLTLEGYKVFTAEDGSRAISIIREQHLDLVICDLFMPHVSGFSLIAALREIFDDRLPIIVISSPRNKATLDAMNLGMLDFIPKPVQMPALLEMIKKYEKLCFNLPHGKIFAQSNAHP